MPVNPNPTAPRPANKALLVYLAIGCLFVLLQLGGSPVTDLLQFERQPIAHGQWWRFLTASLVHAGWPHLMVNVVALLIVAMTVGRGLNATQTTLSWIFSSLATTIGLWFWNPGLDWYLGASGAVHGLLFAGAIPLALQRDTLAVAILTLLTAKLLWEQQLGPIPGSEASADVKVIVDAHLYGAIGGIFAVAPNYWLVRSKHKAPGGR